jgi:nickel-dependent lactate racemase
MVECWLPYGRTEIHVTIPIQDLMGVIEPAFSRPLEDAPGTLERAVRGALEGECAERVGKAPIAIALEGTLDPNLAALSSSRLVEGLREGGAPPEGISIIVGNGWRRRGDPQLLEALKGQAALRGVKIYEHTNKTKELTNIGSTSRGTEVSINSLFASASFRIVIGETQPDALTGFKGPHSVLVPGISSLKTAEMNRIHALRGVPGPGEADGNPLLEDALEAAGLAGVDLSINLVSTPDGKLMGVYTGGLEEALKRAIADFRDVYRVRVEDRPDILILSAGGFKYDYDLYSSIWALGAAETLMDGGLSIILVAECSGGLGAEGLRTISRVERAEDLKGGYILGAEALQLLRSTLRRCQVHVVSALPWSYLEPLGLRPSRTANEALASIMGGRRGRRTLVMPRGCITIPYIS